MIRHKNTDRLIKLADKNFDIMVEKIAEFDRLDISVIGFVGYDADFAFFVGDRYGYYFDLDYFIKDVKSPICRLSIKDALDMFSCESANRWRRNDDPCLYNGL